LIERLTGDEDESEKSMQVPLRLLIDEIVEDLSRNGPREQKQEKSTGACTLEPHFIPLGVPKA